MAFYGAVKDCHPLFIWSFNYSSGSFINRSLSNSPLAQHTHTHTPPPHCNIVAVIHTKARPIQLKPFQPVLLPNTYEVYRRMLLRLHRGAGSVVQFLSNSVSRELRDSCAFQNATRIKLSRGCCQKTTPPLASGDRLAVHS